MPTTTSNYLILAEIMGANTISWYCGGESRGNTGGARGRTASQRGSLRRTAGEDNIDRDAAQGSRDGNVAAAGTVTVVPSRRGGAPAGVTNPNLPLHNDIPTLRRNCLRSRKPPLWKAEQLVNNNVKTVNLWRQNCQLVKDPEVREWFEKYDCDTTGANLDRALWVKLNRIRSGYGRCADYLYKWGSAPGCECGAPRQTITHIRAECPLLSFQGSWSE
nr:unnamed protein product [Callosobruchus analis]